MKRRYAIIGVGAVGGFYGARLQRAGCDVHFLLHSDYEHVRQHGLWIESKDGDLHLPVVNAYRRASDLPHCDVVIVALKATQNHLLAGMLRKEDTVLLMQNGLGAEDEIARIVGADHVLGGLAFLCSNKVGPGHIRHLDYGYVTLAEYCGGITERLRAIGADFERAGITVQYADNLLAARWRKLVWNIPFNGLSVILNATTERLMTDPHTRALVEDLMREVLTGAAACGYPIEPAFIEKMVEETLRMKPYKTSMMLDFEARRPMEVEAIYGNPLRAASIAGASMPRVETLYRQLKFLDAVISKQKG